MPAVNTAAVQSQAFSAASGVTAQVLRYQRRYLRAVPPVKGSVAEGVRGLRRALGSAREARSTLRNIVNPDREVLWRLLLGRQGLAQLQDEAQATLDLLRSGEGWLDDLRGLQEGLNQAIVQVSSISLPSPVRSCREFERLGRGQVAIERALRTNLRLLGQAGRKLDQIWGQRGQIIADFAGAIRLVTRFRSVGQALHQSRQVVLTGLRAVGFGAWGWRVVGSRESRWGNLRWEDKKDLFFAWARDLKRDSEQAYEGVREGAAELSRAIDGVPALRRELQAMKQEGEDTLSQVESMDLPPVCSTRAPSAGTGQYSGLNPSSFGVSPGAIILGGLTVGFALSMIWSERR